MLARRHCEPKATTATCYALPSAGTITIMDKTELIWTGTEHNLSKIPGCGRALTLGAAHVAQSDDVLVLGVQLSSDLSLDKHVNVVSAKCFFSTTTTTPHPTFS